MDKLTEILALVRMLLPVGASIATAWVHNPASTNKLNLIISDVETVAALAQALTTPAAPAA